ncbi:MAG TPA: thiamine pyrophosphate-requiring protein [Alphaproteobacteria bacterium]|nr:thiamine pyrophosphate-requiring protein [Alphaproteobacteria bacterium]
MATTAAEGTTVADSYLRRLADSGITHFFANAGTDFAPLIEAFAKAQALGTPVPKPIAVPHENVAVAMAMGYYLAGGKPAAVMVHTNVGTANGICSLLNSARLNIPMLFSAGRTPINETGPHGSRSIDIHWTQEMFDQAGMVREAVKWDYELRSPYQVDSVVDRALNVAMAEPRGPVYLTLPREVLATAMPAIDSKPAAYSVHATVPYPDPAAIEQVAALLAEARNPLIITAFLGADHAAVAALAKLTEDWAIPVISYRSRSVCLPSSHPMNFGRDHDESFKEADLILVVDCAVPWIPARQTPRPSAKVAHIGVDPHYIDHPIRGFQADVAITAASRTALAALSAAAEGRRESASERIAARRTMLAERQAAAAKRRAAKLEKAKSAPAITPALVSYHLGLLKPEDAIVIRESPLDFDFVDFNLPGTMLGGSSGLGWGLGGAIGAKIAAPDKLVICTQGDGTYMFGNPLSAHFVARAQDAPFLTIIFNNMKWNAVSRSTMGMYPNGYAAKANREPLTHLEPSPDFEQVAISCGGYGEKVEKPEDLPGALKRAIDAVTVEKRQAVLNIICRAA